MNTFKKICLTLGVAAAFTAMPVEAQSSLTDAAPLIVTPHNQSISYRERTLCYDIKANVPFEVAADQSWVTVRKGSDGTVYVHIETNYYANERTANVTFSNAEKGITRTLVITQEADGSAADLPVDVRFIPSSAQDNNHANTGDDGGIANSYDDNLTTLYHSSYNADVSASNPVILTYNFTDADRIDYVTYVPRQSGDNGLFGEVEIYVKLQGESDYKLFGSYDFGFSSASKTIEFGETGLVNPASVQFKVKTGKNNYASCAEMKFCKRSGDFADYAIFADDIYTTLKDGVTEEDIDKMTDPFAKSLATKIFRGEYDTNYRVAEYPCLLNVTTLSNRWNTAGKLYDQFPGVTGITYAPGTYAVAVSGLPEGKTATLKIVSWYNGKIGDNFNGGDPQTLSFPLSNGMNVIDYDPMNDATFFNGTNKTTTYSPDFDGLAYIDYNDTEDPSIYPNIKVHFVNGVVNGYISEDKTNAENLALAKSAKNKHMDVVSNKVHAVWNSASLASYCKATDGTTGFSQYMNVLDSLITWEHEILGFGKYNHVPQNRTFAYVNYTYYMFQGGLGVSFIYSEESRILDCNKLINSDDDAIWGLSHEWGHQHQMHPYFCWKGMTEVTNNMNSYYNIMKMGYRSSDKINQWAPARRHFIDDNPDGRDKISGPRRNAYENRSALSWNSAYYNLATAMADSTIYDYDVNPARALGINEVSVGETLCPFIMLYVYFTRDKNMPDFAPDWYEALRQTDQEGGSTIEKEGGLEDKYELIAAAQNGNKNNAIAKLAQRFPESVWTKYITTTNCGQWQNNMPYVMNYIRKVSRLSGYNLFPYFERWGFLRQTAIYIGDYGDGWQIFTPEAYDEFKADMDALVADGTLQAMPEGMVEEISNTTDMFRYDENGNPAKPQIPNTHNPDKK